MLENAVSLVTRLSVILAEILVVVLTWVKTFRHTRAAALLQINVTVTSILLRDGTRRFLFPRDKF